MNESLITDSFIQRLEAISLYMKTVMRGYFGGSHRTNSYGSTVEFADFREYVLGDDLRRIDWNLFSRFEKFFIKLFTDERQMHIQIFIDCSKSMNYKNSLKGQFALQAAAALGYIAVQNMDKVSIKLIHDDRADDLCGVVSGKSAYLRALFQLNDVEFYGTANISKAVTTSQGVGFSDGMTVIISDFMSENNWKSAVDYLLYRHREVMLVQTLDEDEANPMYRGRNILIDSESTDRIDPRNLKIKITRSDYDAYLRALEDFLGDLKSFSLKRGLHYMYSLSHEPIENVFFKQLFETGVIK